jgi:hypothetical protein
VTPSTIVPLGATVVVLGPDDRYRSTVRSLGLGSST